MTVALAFGLAGVAAAFADPPDVGSSTSTEVTTTVSAPSVTPAGDLIIRPVAPISNVPLLMVKAKSFTQSLYVRRETRRLQREIQQNRGSAVKWALVRGVYIHPASSRHLAASGLPALRLQLREAVKQKDQQQWITQHPPNLPDWLCIHHYEGSWNDTGAPYWGGLQLSLDFQRRYAPRLFRVLGTADHWTPLEQIWAAVNAARTRGFEPWPNTAPRCGLL